jgi:hypothetical protein
MPEAELVRAIHDFQAQLTPQYCGNFINHLRKVKYKSIVNKKKA